MLIEIISYFSKVVTNVYSSLSKKKINEVAYFYFGAPTAPMKCFW